MRITLLVFLLMPLSVLAQDLISLVQPHPEDFRHNDPGVIEIAGTMPDGCPISMEVADLSSQQMDVTITRDTQEPCTQALTSYRFLADPASHPNWPVTFNDEIQVMVSVLDSVSREVLGSESHTVSVFNSASHNYITYPMQSGIWESPQAPVQGVLVDAQGDRAVIYPLGYGADGNSRWSIAGGSVVNGVFSASASQVRNGPCLSCSPLFLGPPIAIDAIGQISAVVSDSGAMLLQVPGSQALEYRHLDYHQRAGSGLPEGVPDLSGNWVAVAQSPVEFAAAPYEIVYLPGSSPSRFVATRQLPSGSHQNGALPETMELVCNGAQCECDPVAGSCPPPIPDDCEYPVRDLGEQFMWFDFICPNINFIVQPPVVQMHRQPFEAFER